MNKERILALADLIEKQPHTPLEDRNGFNMADLVRTCGTPACIAGWAAWEAQGRPEEVEMCKIDWSIESTAGAYLGLQKADEAMATTAEQLFYPEYEGCFSYEDITPAQAAACLRHLAETGEVDWDRAIEEAV